MDTPAGHFGSANAEPWAMPRTRCSVPLRRFRILVARARAGPFSDLVRQLAGVMQTATAFVAVFADESHRELRTLAFHFDDAPRENFSYRPEGAPCEHVLGRAFRYVPNGVPPQFPPRAIFATERMDSYAAFPLHDSSGALRGLLVAMDRQPIADAALAEALLKIFAWRFVAEIDRSRSDEALRTAALAVSGT